MPRGVYDRSKAKSKKAAPAEATEAPKAKRKYTRRAAVPAVGEAGEGTLAQGVVKGGPSVFELTQLAQFLGNLVSLQSSAPTDSGLASLIRKTVKTLESQFDATFPGETTIGSVVIEKAVTALPTPEKFVIPPPPVQVASSAS